MRATDKEYIIVDHSLPPIASLDGAMVGKSRFTLTPLSGPTQKLTPQQRIGFRMHLGAPEVRQRLSVRARLQASVLFDPFCQFVEDEALVSSLLRRKPDI